MNSRDKYIRTGYNLATYIGVNIAMMFIGVHFNFPKFIPIYIIMFILMTVSLYKYNRNRNNKSFPNKLRFIELALLIINQIFLIVISAFESELIIEDGIIQKVVGVNIFWLVPMILILVYIRMNTVRWEINKI